MYIAQSPLISSKVALCSKERQKNGCVLLTFHLGEIYLLILLVPVGWVDACLGDKQLNRA
jgi:hypothetical protein